MEGERWASPLTGARTTRARVSKGAPSPYPVTKEEDLAECTTFNPPEWRRPWHRMADLGYPDYLPPRPGQEEDEMTDALVKNGFKGRSVVSLNTESFVGHNLIHDMLVHDDGANLDSLATLLHDVFDRRNSFISGLGPSTFKMPMKTALPESKNEVWIADLANPHVPLGKLAQIGVPQDLKGHELLDMLHSKNIPVPRAVWYIRVLGANETLSQRSRPNFNPSGYSVEWANVVTSYLKRQLADIALPTIQRPGINMKQIFRSVLSDPESRDAWASRFAYSLALLREFYPEGLVDHATLLFWISQQIIGCNLAQCSFIVGLAEEYFDGLVQHRGFMTPFLEGCLQKLVEIDSSSVKEHLLQLQNILKGLVQRSFLAASDCFVSPRIWTRYSTVLRSIIYEPTLPWTGSTLVNEEQHSQQIQQNLRNLYPTIEARNLALQFKSLPERAMASVRSIMADIHALNSITSSVDVASFRFFEPISDDLDAFYNKLDVLLTWSVTSSQCGDHRPYAACTILSKWMVQAKLRATRRKAGSPSEILQEQLFKWLDTSDMARDHKNNLDGVALLYGRLVEHGLFSYTQFIQKLMARGETGRFVDDGPSSHLLTLLNVIPIVASSTSLLNERKAALYGISKPSPVATARQMRITQELRTALPWVFAASTPLPMETLQSATRFEKIFAVRHWLMPIIKQQLATRASVAEEIMGLETYSSLVDLMVSLKGYRSLLELSLFLLTYNISKDLLLACLDTFRRYADIWNSMDVFESISESLLLVQQRFRSAGIRFRPLTAMVDEIAQSKEREPLLSANSAVKVTQPIHQGGHLPPAIIVEIIALGSDSNPNAASALARSLWYAYHDAPNLGWVVWRNVVQATRQIPDQWQDHHEQLRASSRYADFLFNLGEEMPTTLDDSLRPHLSASYKDNLAPDLDVDSWNLIVHLLLELVSRGGLSTITVLEGIIYPAWTASAAPASNALDTINQLAGRLLLLQYDFLEQRDDLPPYSPSQAHRLQSQSQTVFKLEHFTRLLANMPFLVALELNQEVTEDVRRSCAHLRFALCQDPRFRLSAFRHVDLVRDAFLKPTKLSGATAALEGHLVDALRLIVSSDGSSACPESDYDMQAICTRLNPWGFSRSAIELQLTFKRLCDGAAGSDTRAQAESDLEKFTTSFLGHALTPGETDLVADVLRGISGPVAERFVNLGMDRLTQILTDLPPEPTTEEVAAFLLTCSEVLRLLASVIQPLRGDVSIPKLEPKVRANFVGALQRAMENVDSMLPGIYGDDTSSITEEVTRAQAAELVVIQARLLQFLLGFPEGWTAKLRDSLESILAILMSWVVGHGGGLVTDGHIFPLLLDTASYLIDEIPKDPKSPNYDITRQIPTVSPSNLPAAMPLDFSARLQLILSYTPRIPSVTNLVHLLKGTSTTAIFGKRVQVRPWDWMEYADPGVTEEDENHTVNRLGKNNTSISLEAFGARPTGETVHYHKESSQRAEVEIRASENRIHGETVFQRDWRESRIIPTSLRRRQGSAEDEDGDEDANGSSVSRTELDRDEVMGSASPAPSTKTTWSSLSQQKPSAETDVIDVDALPNASTWRPNKRKAPNSGDAPEGRMIVEVVVPSVPGKGKGKGKGKGTVATKTVSTRGKK